MYNPGCPSPDLCCCRGFLRQELFFMSSGASEDFCSWPGHLSVNVIKHQWPQSPVGRIYRAQLHLHQGHNPPVCFCVCCALAVLEEEEQEPFHLSPCPWRALWVFLGCLNIWDTEFWHRNVFLCGDQQSESWKQSSSLWRVSRPALWIITSGWSCTGGSTGDAQKASPHSAASPSPCLCDLLTPVRCRAFSCKKSCSAQEELCLLHCNSKM